MVVTRLSTLAASDNVERKTCRSPNEVIICNDVESISKNDNVEIKHACFLNEAIITNEG